MGLYRVNNGELESLSGSYPTGLPVGALITMKDYSSIPEGYLVCNGSTFNTALYPLLYTYLGSNTLPIEPIKDVEADPDWFRTNSSTYPGSATVYDANVANMPNLFPTTATRDGVMEVHTDDWCYIHVIHSDGTTTTYSSRRSDVWASNLIYIKEGDSFVINRTEDNFTDWVYIEYTYVKIWYYNNYKLIKATAGSSDADATNIYNNIVHYIQTECPTYSYDSDDDILYITMRT